jgi:D-alanyl-D-alanine carboxypeptidase/D-alanyl-D-alanine-endopeptidase (penicillin-binding protein 4)
MLSDIIRETNVKSNNHFAEHLLRIIGRKSNPNIYSDPLKEGIEAIDKFWKQKGIATQSIVMKDGSGLAPQNAVSPEFLCEVLGYMNNQSENKSVFFDSLPKAGLDGTLKSFMKGTKFERKIAAKSGSIEGVQCYAGYLMDGSKKYAFAVMVNKFNGTRSEVRSAIEKFLLSL